MKKLLICLVMLFATNAMFAQDVSLKGRVVDEEGLALPGVNVFVKGSTVGSMTDIDGLFDLEVKANKTNILVFSSLGLATYETVIGDQIEFNVILKEDAIGLDEVVVVGYGTQKKCNLTGAVSVIDSKTLENRPVANVQQAIQGAAPGLMLSVGNAGGEAGASMSMRIRGFGSISGGGEPYVIVDGFPLGSTSEMNDINPDDIKSISVLKDAASTAIYGSRAAYGVIVITTKSGKGAQGIHFSYSNNFVYASPLKTPEMMNSLEFAEYFNIASVNSGGTVKFPEAIIQKIKETMEKGGTGTEANWDKSDWKGYTSSFANTDWFDVMYKDNVARQKHNINISGNSDNSSYYFSSSYYTHEGIMNFGDDEFDRYTANAKINTQVTSWLKFNVNFNFSRTDIDRPSYSRGLYLHNIARRWPTNPVKAPNGDYFWSSEIPFLLQGGRYKNQNNRLNTSVGFIIEPIKDLTITARLYYSNGAYTYGSHQAVVSFRKPDNSLKYMRKKSETSFSRYFRNFNYISPNVFVTYKKSINNNNFAFLTGYQQELNQYSSLSGSKKDLTTDRVPSIKTAVGDESVGDSEGHSSTQGIFGRFTYNYKEKYLFETNFRYDGSSRFEEGSRWGFFPSMSAGYNVAKEGFWKVKTISLLKIRASYGSIGNQQVPNYTYLPLMPVNTKNWWMMNGERPVYTRMPNLISPSLTWETVTTSNFGLDIVAFKEKLNVSLEIFKRETTDMLGPAEAYPEVLGITAPKENNAELVTKGFEFGIKWSDNIGDFNYSVGFNISNAMTEITKFRNPTKLLKYYYKGQKLGTIWGYETHGIIQTDEEAAKWHDQSKISKDPLKPGDIAYEDLNGDGKIDWGKWTADDHGDQKKIGNSTSQYPVALSLSANWKGVDFSMFFQGVMKRDLWIGGAYFWGAAGNMWQSAGFKSHKDYWTPENRDAYYPRPMFGNSGKNQQKQTKYLQDASYIRLKNIQVGYSIPKKYLYFINCNKLRVFVAGENLLTFTDLADMFDPETTGGRWGAGKIYPLQKSISLGLSIKF